ncbi:MAG TPA: hypothetical protein VKR52_16165 [Terracidiphilus sp.]|nr:hypothetical protein [Terracidiphilus sp.]
MGLLPGKLTQFKRFEKPLRAPRPLPLSRHDLEISAGKLPNTEMDPPMKRGLGKQQMVSLSIG